MSNISAKTWNGTANDQHKYINCEVLDSGAAALLVGGTITLTNQDIQIGAVEIKDATSDTRALVKTAGSVVTTSDNVLVIQQIDSTGAIPNFSSYIGTVTALTSGNLGTVSVSGTTSISGTVNALTSGNLGTVSVSGTTDVVGTVTVSGTPNVAVTSMPTTTVTGTVTAELTNIDIEIGAVELKDATSDTRAKIKAADGTTSASDNVLLIQQLDSSGNISTGGASTLSADYASPFDFTASFGSNTTVNATGAPFTIDDSNCFVSYIYYKPSGSTWQSPIINGIAGDSISASSGTVTVAGAGTPFASGDEYHVGIIYQEKEHNAALDAKKVVEVAPLSDQYTGETLVDETNGTDGTYYYYVDMASYNKSGFQLTLDSGSGTITATFEGSIQDDGTAAASCTYQDITNDLFGTASLQDTSGAGATDMWLDDTGASGLLKYSRIKVVSSTGTVNDADWTVYHKRLY